MKAGDSRLADRDNPRHADKGCQCHVAARRTFVNLGRSDGEGALWLRR